jgi:peptide/nickel transport system permease protein
MSRQTKEIPYLSHRVKIIKSKDKVVKRVILWLINNLKFLFIPGFQLEDLDKRRTLYEIFYPRKHILKRYKSPLFIFGTLIILFICTLAVFPDWLSPYSYLEATTYTGLDIYKESFLAPSQAHPLGQTFYGLDVLARIIFGTRSVLLLAFLSTLFACMLGIFIGAISGYFEGWLDAIIMRGMDIILSFPGIIFAIVLITIWGGDFIFLVIIYSLIGTPYFARLIRSNVLKEKLLPYVTAGKVSGAKSFRIIFRHILPNCILPLIVAASFNIARNILSLTVLGFLRFGGIEWWEAGYHLGWIEWGYDIALVINRFYTAPWTVIFPSLMISVSVIGFLLVGDGLSDFGLMGQEVL